MATTVGVGIVASGLMLPARPTPMRALGRVNVKGQSHKFRERSRGRMRDGGHTGSKESQPRGDVIVGGRGGSVGGGGGPNSPRHDGKTRSDLELVVERRLRRSAAEKKAMRAVVRQRLAEREAALELAVFTERAKAGTSTTTPPLLGKQQPLGTATLTAERPQIAALAQVSQRKDSRAVENTTPSPDDAEATITATPANAATAAEHGSLAQTLSGNTATLADLNNNSSDGRAAVDLSTTAAARGMLQNPQRPHVGPWDASMRTNPQLDHVRRIRQLEDEAITRMERRRLEESKKASLQRERAARARRREQSMNVKARVLAGEEDRRRREAVARAEIEKNSQRIALRKKRSEDHVASTKATMARAQRKKAWLRDRRATHAHERREKRARADYMKRVAIIERMHAAMQGAQAQARLDDADPERNIGRFQDKDRRKRAEQYVQDSLQASARELAAREAHRREVMARCEEKHKDRVSGLVRKNKERTTRAVKERTKLERAQVRRKEKLARDKQKKFEAITVERARQQYLGDELRRQIDDRDAQLRDFAAGMLGTVDHVTSIEELRSMAAQLEDKYTLVAQAQQSESWNAYRSASAMEDKDALAAAKSVSRVFSRPPSSAGGYSKRPHTSGRQRRRRGGGRRGGGGATLPNRRGVGSRKGTGGTIEYTSAMAESEAGTVPARPSTAGVSGGRKRRGNRAQRQRSGGDGGGGRAGRFAHRHRSPSRPGSSGARSTNGGATRGNDGDMPLKHHYGTDGRGGICALCRHRFALLPCRVMRKAVVEMRAEMGIHNRNIHKWKTAVLYDQVPVCTFCSQWLLPGGAGGGGVSGRGQRRPFSPSNVSAPAAANTPETSYSRVRRCGPIRKSVDQLDRERDRRLTHARHLHSLEADGGNNKEDGDATQSSKEKKGNKKGGGSEVAQEVEVSVSVRIHGGGRSR
jgi:hypothetical protein